MVGAAAHIVELLSLPFQPGASGYASVFTGFYPVALTIWLCAMIWLEILFMRARSIPAIFFVEQPPTYQEAFDVQRFQSSLSSFTCASPRRDGLRGPVLARRIPPAPFAARCRRRARRADQTTHH